MTRATSIVALKHSTLYYGKTSRNSNKWRMFTDRSARGERVTASDEYLPIHVLLVPSNADMNSELSSVMRQTAMCTRGIGLVSHAQSAVSGWLCDKRKLYD